MDLNIVNPCISATLSFKYADSIITYDIGSFSKVISTEFDYSVKSFNCGPINYVIIDGDGN